MAFHCFNIRAPMPSIFGHLMASTLFTQGLAPVQQRPKMLFWAGFCAFFPDLDVLGFHLGISYSSIWGHRGFTHSLVFGLFFGLLMAVLLAWRSPHFKKVAVLMVLSTVSHPLLDMLTNGGRGCALWWPFSEARIFFPFRPIQVSPLGMADFFGAWGLEALASEVLWIGLPCCLIYWIWQSLPFGR